MKYDIYFHNDFDGRASAAVMLNFLESRGDAAENYFPVDYTVPWSAKKLAPSSVRNPAVVVDFLFHPEAKFWFDHHKTTFLKKEWERNFRADKFREWNPKSPSACGLVLRTLKNNFGYKPPRYISELAKWLDVIDSASYRSAKQTIDKKEPALQLEEVIDVFFKKTEREEWLIRLLSGKPMKEIVRGPRVARLVARLKVSRAESIEFYKKNLKIEGKLAFVDISGVEPEKLRFAPYYFFPKARYAFVIKKGSRGNFHITLGVNPWRKGENKKHIGEFMEKNFGGGGHHDVGGAEFRDRASVEKAVEKIIRNFA